MLIAGLIVGLFLIFLLVQFFLVLNNRVRTYQDAEKKDIFPTKESRVQGNNNENTFLDGLKRHLSYRYRRGWKRKVNILLVMGAAAEVEQVAPGLTAQRWLEGDGVVLIWGGESAGVFDHAQLKELRQLRRRPLDSMVWIVDEKRVQDAAFTDAMARRLHDGYRTLGWNVPLYLWQVRQSQWEQQDRDTQPVGCVLPAGCRPHELAAGLDLLTPRLTQKGMQQVMINPRHDFLLRLAQDLADGGIDRIKQALTPLIAGPQSVRLAGMMFSLPVAAREGVASHGWLPDAGWGGIIGDVGYLPARRLGVDWSRTAQWGIIGLALIWGAGSLVSFLNNRAQIIGNGQLAGNAAREGQSLGDRLLAQLSLQQEMGRLEHNVQAGSPWYTRFGLDQSQAQLDALWPVYQRGNNRLMRDVVAERLQDEIALLSLQSHQDTGTLYNSLKAYLMMARPGKADPAFLARNLARVWPRREGVTEGVWQATAPSLLAFYAQHLPAHPEWRIEPDTHLVAQARKSLLRQSARQDMENTLYQKMLQQVAHQTPDLTLTQLTGDTDVSLLFTNDGAVPGMFTRQGWENQVREAIDRVVSQRSAEADWVLSDNRAHEQALSSDDLKARLRDRYFNDFATAWLDFLNNMQWQPANSLSDSIDQLTLMADARQSPLSALMKALAWQAATGKNDLAIGGAVEQSTRNLFRRVDSEQDKLLARQPGPLDDTFGPLLAVLDPQAAGQGNNSLSLQTFLIRLTRVRLKLQQITNAPDPQAMAQAMAQTVFQGKTVDLSDTRDYGSLLAASLGQAWSNFGDALFVQPVEQAWKSVLSPTAASLNTQWRHAIVNDWNAAFDGRYPFRATASDASLPLLAQYLRADTGRIARFLDTRLSGVLHKEGSQWVPDAINSQGMPINPEFLRRINQLSQLADIVFADGDAGMRFELMARPARDIVQTDLTIDGQNIKYFNQMESWIAIGWPGNHFRPGVMLTWTSTTSGNREYANLQGPWGLIRLLEKAKVTPIDSSRYQLMWRAQDGLPLNYILRTELGKGPLALLELRDFRMPDTIFVE
ncbi:MULTISPECIES: ImcF-related family protein [unclassified Brenneria]|uniref:ImcF-related family protein n=1 Tax=unclassified Brenneria TaxID=2634434 RepID=UPI0029C2321E|nr:MULTISPECIES: ImcF-related family protein [unclassified Brenneria]MDX5631046.1 ImcF-related family protein [Brenneria sp. L3-3Z]MDX5698118.1 ImcF-related family protein [Brenneria sp. L4-2C]